MPGQGAVAAGLLQPPVSDSTIAKLKISNRPSKLYSLFRSLMLHLFPEPDFKPLF